MSNNNLTASELNETMLQILHDERKRISADLHDNVQNKLRLLRDKYLKLHPDFAADVNAILEEVRHVAYQLIPKNLQKYPLTDYLRIYAVTLQQTYSKQFKVDYQTNVEIAVPKQVEMELFRIVQETFNNVLKHAPDTPAFLMRYLQRDENLVLILQDFGEGFDLDAAFEKGTMGLDSIRTRAQLIGAECFIETGRFEGCKIKISLPIEKLNFSDDEPREIPTSYNNSQPQKNSQGIDRILIVDNQPEYGEFLQNEIQKAFGIRAKYRKSAKAARTYLESIDYQIDVVITDITMPDESGIKMIKKLRKEEPNKVKDIHFIIYSINDSPAYVFQACKVLNVKGYIYKEEQSAVEDIIEALKQVQRKEEKPYYSGKIVFLADCFNPSDYDAIEDKKNRELFQIYRAVESAYYCESSREKDKKYYYKNSESFKTFLKNKGKRDKVNSSSEREAFLVEVHQRLMVKDKTYWENCTRESIDKLYARFLEKLGFHAASEAYHLLGDLSNDLGLNDCA